MHTIQPTLSRRPVAQVTTGPLGGWRLVLGSPLATAACLTNAMVAPVLLALSVLLGLLVYRDGASEPAVVALVHGAAAGAALTCLISGCSRLVARTRAHVQLHHPLANRQFLARHRAGPTASRHRSSVASAMQATTDLRADDQPPDDTEHDDARLVVPATAACSARFVIDPAAGALLVVDYGGYELAFTVQDLRAAEHFGIHLAFAAMSFASDCRHQREAAATE